MIKKIFLILLLLFRYSFSFVIWKFNFAADHFLWFLSCGIVNTNSIFVFHRILNFRTLNEINKHLLFYVLSEYFWRLSISCTEVSKVWNFSWNLFRFTYFFICNILFSITHKLFHSFSFLDSFVIIIIRILFHIDFNIFF